MANSKVVLLKTTKVTGRGFVPAGETIEVSPEVKKDFISRGIISDGKAPVQEDSKEVQALKNEIQTQKEEIEKLEKEIETLKVPAKKEDPKKDDLLGGKK